MKQWLTGGPVGSRVALFSALLLLPSAAAATALAGTEGAIRIQIEMPEDGVATLGLYTESGQLVRILAQAVRLTSGSHTALWDGMDLWGHPLPAGTTVTAKLIHGPGLQAFYEFDLGRGDVPASHPGWLTRPMGEGAAMRTGGWLGDHTGPGAAAAVGDKVFFGSKVVEHGHPIIACDLDGNKLWGGRVAGWDGPESLHAVEGSLLARVRNSVWRIDPATFRAERLFDTGNRPIVALAAGAGRLTLVLRNPDAAASPFRPAIGHADILHVAALPQMLGDDAPDRQLSARRRFSGVFCGEGGHFQIGLEPVLAKGAGHVVLPFTQPRQIGTLVLARPSGIASVEVFRLKPGLAYDPLRHSPLAGAEAEALDLDLGDLDPNWERVAASRFPTPVVFLPMPPDQSAVSALHLRFLPAAGKGLSDRPRLGICRLLDRRVEVVCASPRIAVPAEAAAASRPEAGWDFRMPAPVHDDAPAAIVVDCGRVVSADGLFFLNNTSTRFDIEAFAGPGDPPASGPWTPVAAMRLTPGGDGYASASKHGRTTYVAFASNVMAMAFRLRVVGAYGGGRVGLERKPDDGVRVDCDRVLPVRLMDPLPRPKPHLVQLRAATDGQLLSEIAADCGALSALAADDTGALFAARRGTLCQITLDAGMWRETVLNDTDLAAVRALACANGEIVAGESGRVAFLDRTGTLLRTVGKGQHERGPWDRGRIGNPAAVTVDRNGKLWIAEAGYAPKRISRFAADGTCEKEIFGPPQYGGGGWLDPDLSSFYYRGMQFALDWENGLSRLLNLNDRHYTEETPSLDASSFAYTQIGRPITVDGRRYVVGDAGNQFGPGIVICRLDGATWKPCVVAGAAKGSPFLLRKEVWKRHWQTQQLENRLFIWSDLNGDGAYAVEEVDLFLRSEVPGNPFEGGYWGTWMGPDLTLWSPSARLAPDGFTPHGVPRYDRRTIQGFSYAKLAPFYGASQSSGSRAASGPSATTIVAADGSLSLCGQPYRVLPDGRLAGGDVNVQPSDYIPPVPGRLIHQALHPAGSAITASPVGEVVMHVGDSGVWSLTGVRDCVMLDQVFTGEDGGWGTDLPSRRGIEVTRRKHDQETFFGHFIKARDGRYFAVAGKGFHALCRLEGLDAFRVRTYPVRVEADTVAPNAVLRQRLVAQQQARLGRRKEAKRHAVTPAAAVKPRLSLDGFLDEWPRLEPLDPADGPEDPPATHFFSAAADDKGLYLAYRGCSHTGNHCTEPAYLFNSGLSTDLRYRTDPASRGGELRQGDRRVVFGRVGDRWQAVLYDYVNPEAPEEEGLTFTSPVLSTQVSRVTVLRDTDVTVTFRPDDLAVLSEAERRHGPQAWCLEVFVTWHALGFAAPPREIRADVGVMLPDSGGVTVDRRLAWSEPGPLAISDVAAEAQLAPAAWGTFSLPQENP